MKPFKSLSPTFAALGAIAALAASTGVASAAGCTLAKGANTNDLGCDYRGQLQNRSEVGPLDLSYGLFGGANFSGEWTTINNTNFRGSILSRADLSSAWVTESDFRNTRDIGTNFRGTHLAFSDFGGADLSEADFTGADLMGVSMLNLSMGGTGGTDPVGLPAGWKIMSTWPANPSKVHIIGPYAGVAGADLDFLPRAINYGAKIGRVCGRPASLSTGWAYLRVAPIDTYDPPEMIGTKYDCNGVLLGPGADVPPVETTDSWGQKVLQGIDLSRRDLRSLTLNGAKLTNANLAGANLSGVNLQYADLSGANLTGANLTYANLSDAKLDGATLERTNFSRATLVRASLTGTYLNSTNLSYATLGYADLGKAMSSQANFSNADLYGVKAYDFQPGQNTGSAPKWLPDGWKLVNGWFVGPGMRLYSVPLSGADLRGVDLTGADLLDADLTFSNLTGANLSGAWIQGTNMTGANLTGILSPGIRLGTRWEYNNSWSRPTVPTGWAIAFDPAAEAQRGILMGPGANLAGQTVVGGDLACTDLTGAQLDGIAARNLSVNRNDFNGVWGGCSGAVTLPAGWVLGNGYLIGPKANLTGINVDGLDLSRASLTGSTSGNIIGTPSALPSGWRLVGGWLAGPGANLAGAKLANRDLTGIDLTGSNLAGIDLSGANLTNAKLGGANLTNALMAGTTIAGTALSGSTLTGARGFLLKGTPATMPVQWTVFRGTFLGPGASFAGLDMRGTNLSGWNLTGVDLSGTKLNGVNLSGAKLGGAKLVGADLTGATLTGASMDGADFSGANLYGVTSGSITTLRGTGPSATDVAPSLPGGWGLAGGFLAGPGAKLAGANLANANLAGVDLTGAVLTGATTGPLSYGQTPAKVPTGWIAARGNGGSWLIGPGAKVGAAYLANANLTGANLSGVDLSAATLDWVTSSGITGTPAGLPAGWKLISGRLLGKAVQLPSGTSLAGADLSNLDLTGLGGVSVNFSGANLSGTKLNGAYLDHANLSRANLSGASLRNAFPTAANLTGANLTNADVTGTSFRGATITGANLSGVDLGATMSPYGLYDVAGVSIVGTPKAVPAPFKLIGGNLVGPSANLRNANLTGADLSNMDLSNANLTGAVLRNAKLTGALLYGTSFADSYTSPTISATLSGVQSGGVRLTSECGGGSRCFWMIPLPSGWQIIGGYLIGPGANLTGANLDGLDLSQATLTGITGTGITGTPKLPCGWYLTGGRLTSLLISGELRNQNLTGADLTCMNLTGIKSSGLTGTPKLASGWGLRKGYLVGPKADLTGADLRSTSLIGLSLSDANLTNAKLDSASLGNVDLRNANLTGASLTSTNLSYANLAMANLTGANLTGANVQGVDMSSARITNVTAGGLTGTVGAFKLPRIPTERFGWMYWHIRGGYLIGPGVNLAGADLHGVNLSGTAGQNDGVNLRGANLEGTNLQGANLNGTILWRANLKGADLTGADVRGAGFAGADMTGAKITNAQIDNSNFRVIFNRGASDYEAAPEAAPTKLEGIVSGSLRGVTYMTPEQLGWKVINGYLIGPKADLRNADLRGADISNSCSTEYRPSRTCEMGSRMINGSYYFDGVDLSGADLRGADLRGTKIRNVRIGNTDFRGANMERLLTKGNEGSPILPTQLNYFGDAYNSWDSTWRADYHPYMTGRFWVFDGNVGGSGSIIGPGVELPDDVMVVIGTRDIDGGMIYPIYGTPSSFGAWETVDCSHGPRAPSGAITDMMNKVNGAIADRGGLESTDIPSFGDSWGCRDSHNYLGEPYNHRPIWSKQPTTEKASFYLPKGGDDLKAELWSTEHPVWDLFN